MHKKIINKDDLRNSIVSGMQEITEIVARTLGPGGLPIIIERVGQSLNGEPLGPKITKDGVSVAEECKSEDEVTDLIIQTVKFICKKTNSVVGDGPQPLYSKILTPKGFIKMEDAEIGMQICGTNGSTQEILGVFPKGEKEIYEVEFMDGKVVECCADHLWEVTNNSGIKQVKPTLEIAKDYFRKDSDNNIRYKYYTPQTQVEFLENNSEMPLDPYLVGVLLGDGSLSGSGSVEISLGLAKKHILDNLVVPKGIIIKSTYVDSKNYYRVKLSGKTKNGKSMHDIVNSLGLLGKTSHTKFIPKSYLYASKNSRERLLQGLLDTDGHINKRGNFEYSTVSEELTSDFLELVRSLGKSINITKLHRKPGASYSENPINRITELKGYKYGDKIVRVEKTGKITQMQCIKVSNSDQLYITDNYVVTHNTTSAIVLGNAILQESLNVLENNKDLNPQILKERLEEASEKVLKLLDKMARNVKSDRQIKEVATISANGDSEVGGIIAEAFSRVGVEGVVTIDEGYSNKVTLDIVEGYQINRGAEAGDRFFNDETKTKYIAENVHVIVYDGRLTNYTEIVPILNIIAENHKKGLPPVMIMANEFSRDVIQFLLIQKAELNLSFIAVKGPHQTNVRTAYYDDLAIYLGGTKFGNGNRSLNNCEYEDIGVAEKVIVDKYTTTFYEGLGDEEEVLKRVSQLKASRELAESPYDAQVISDRLASLTQGIAKIGVGGATDLEIKEKYDRIEDALNAAKAAIEEGVIPGGGVSLLRIAQEMKKDHIGEAILYEALKAPIMQIFENIGEDFTNAFELELLESKKTTYDAFERKVVNAYKKGIIDPVKVTKTAFLNAISISSLLATAGGGIVYSKNKK